MGTIFIFIYDKLLEQDGHERFTRSVEVLANKKCKIG